MKNSVLLVGASGFIGSHCLSALRTAGYDVYSTYHNRPHTGGIALDVFDHDSVTQLMSDLRPRYMINCAWYVAHGLFWDADVNTNYVGATLNLYKAFSDSGGARAIFLGTGAELVSNDASRGGDTLYAQSKRKTATLLGKARLEGAGASYLWARLYALYGAGEPRERFVPYLVSHYLAGRAPVVQNPHLYYNFTYAPNLARILIDQLKGDLEGDAACAMDDTLSLADMASYIHAAFFPEGPAPLIEGGDRAPMIFSPAAEEPRVEFAHLGLLSRQDALKDYVARIKDSIHGM